MFIQKRDKGGTFLKHFLVHKLLPGMRTAKDIYANSLLLTPKGTILTEALIASFIQHSVVSVAVEEERIMTNVSEPSFSLRDTKEFQVFKQNFDSAFHTMQDNINAIVQSEAPIDTDALLKQTDSIFTQDMTNFRLFDMLHHMRHYDDSTYVHCINVALICNVFGRWLELEESEVKVLTLCGLLHDIGKLQIPDSIIKKPGKLTENEYSIIKQHPYKGYQLLQKQDLDPRIAQVALLHHERCDGTGYPMGFTSNKITDFSKIVAIADVYDAMTSARIYREGLCPFKVISMLEAEGAQKYDPRFFLPFVEHTINTYLNCDVRLTNGNVGRVVFINKQNLSKPIVKVGTQCIDLSKVTDLGIESII